MKKRKKNQPKLWTSGILTILLLLAAPCGARMVLSGETLNVGTGYPEVQIDDFLLVSGTLNLYPGAFVNESIYALGNSTINIYGGELGAGYFISVCSGENGALDPEVTVYGNDFAVNGNLLDDSATQYVPDNPGIFWTLTGTYGSGGNININLMFSSFGVPVYLERVKAKTEDIEIDIRPGSDENVINLKSRGVVPVAVLTTDEFNAGDLVPGYSISFAGASPVFTKLCDVDCDGDMDVLFFFRTQQLVELNEESTEATLTATLKSAITLSSAEAAGNDLVGSDEVKIKSSKKRHIVSNSRYGPKKYKRRGWKHDDD